MQKLVKEFHKVFNHENFDEPLDLTQIYYIFHNQEKKIEKLLFSREKIIEEEINELIEAYTENNNKEKLDAVCDILYVLYGTGTVLGMKLRDPITLKSITVKEIQTEYNILKNLFKFRNYDEIKKQLYKLINYVYTLGIYNNFNVINAYNEVHRSNMTKYCKNLEELNDTINNYRKICDLRILEKNYKNNKIYIVYNKNTNKILKSVKYSPVDLNNFL